MKNKRENKIKSTEARKNNRKKRRNERGNRPKNKRLKRIKRKEMSRIKKKQLKIVVIQKFLRKSNEKKKDDGSLFLIFYSFLFLFITSSQCPDCLYPTTTLIISDHLTDMYTIAYHLQVTWTSTFFMLMYERPKW